MGAVGPRAAARRAGLRTAAGLFLAGAAGARAGARGHRLPDRGDPGTDRAQQLHRPGARPVPASAGRRHRGAARHPENHLYLRHHRPAQGRVPGCTRTARGGREPVAGQPALRGGASPVRAAAGDPAGKHRRALRTVAGRRPRRAAAAGRGRLQRCGGIRSAAFSRHAQREPPAQPDPAAAALAGADQRCRAGPAAATGAALHRGRRWPRRAATARACRASRPAGVRGLRLVRMRLGGLPEHSRGTAHRHGRPTVATRRAAPGR